MKSNSVRVRLDINELSERDACSLLIGEILLNISTIETFMSVAIINSEPHKIFFRLLNSFLGEKIRRHKNSLHKSPIRFASAKDQKTYRNKLDELLDFRNTISHGLILNDHQGTFINNQKHKTMSRNMRSIAVNIGYLRDIHTLTILLATGLMLASCGEITFSEPKD